MNDYNNTQVSLAADQVRRIDGGLLSRFFYVKTAPTRVMDNQTLFTWLGIAACLFNSALFSGLTIGLFGLSRIRLEAASDLGDAVAAKVLSLRKNANYLLATLLWGNVMVNVLLTLLTDSILTGLGAFFFSTFAITLLGEIAPQAFFSRHVLKVAKNTIPLIHFYQCLLFVFAKPTGWLLDRWLGIEPINYFQEEELRAILKRHAHAQTTDIGHIECLGAENFLKLDDIRVREEGEILDPASIISLSTLGGVPIFPAFERNFEDPFLKQINESKKKWVVITDLAHQPVVVMEANKFVRHVLYEKELPNPLRYCHRPILVTSPEVTLGQVIQMFKVSPEYVGDDVIDHDLILYWNHEKRIITGADLLGRLLRGIVPSHGDHGAAGNP